MKTNNLEKRVKKLEADKQQENKKYKWADFIAGIIVGFIAGYIISYALGFVFGFIFGITDTGSYALAVLLATIIYALLFVGLLEYTIDEGKGTFQQAICMGALGIILGAGYAGIFSWCKNKGIFIKAVAFVIVLTIVVVIGLALSYSVSTTVPLGSISNYTASGDYAICTNDTSYVSQLLTPSVSLNYIVQRSYCSSNQGYAVLQHR